MIKRKDIKIWGKDFFLAYHTKTNSINIVKIPSNNNQLETGVTNHDLRQGASLLSSLHLISTLINL